MAGKDESPSWISGALDLFKGLVDVVKSESSESLESVKKKVTDMLVTRGILFLAFLFIVVGVIKYLAEAMIIASEGLGYVAMGCIMIVLLTAYKVYK